VSVATVVPAAIPTFTYLPRFHAWGIRLTVDGDNRIIPDPQDILTDELRDILRGHREEVLAEIVGWNSGSNAHTHLWVATTLESFEDDDPRYGYEVGRDPVFRMLDAPYFAWLRARMNEAKTAHSNHRLSEDIYSQAVERFRNIYQWAVDNLGENALTTAVRTVNVKLYVPPSLSTLDAYQAGWQAARVENAKRKAASSIPQATLPTRTPTPAPTPPSPQAQRLGHLMHTRGWAALKCPSLNDTIVVTRDASADVSIKIPMAYRNFVRFTLGELRAMRGAGAEAVRGVYETKRVFAGAEVVG
jgi:hypothetical protein